ncbi:MAG: N-acetylmuramoyl-L-alanine amidase, partial [Intestinibacter sp.]|uniref:peptidoglycan recognition protein family protein n=1 Tax=Intestinibacter sp. TaxID=1965304 RepID=UPI003F141788
VTKPKVIDKTPKLTKFNNGGKRAKTTKIIWHYTGKAGVKAIDTINNWFNQITQGYKVNGKYIYASSHYLTDLDGSIYSYIPEDYIAYTSNSANSYSIAVECATTGKDDHYTQEEYESMVKLGAYLADKHNLDPRKDFLTHTDIVGKDYKICPRYFVEHPTAWKQFKQDCYDAMKTKYLIVLKAVNVHNKPDFESETICGKVEPRTALTIVEKIERQGTDMYLTKAGYYITASSKYVEVFTK